METMAKKTRKKQPKKMRRPDLPFPQMKTSWGTQEQRRSYARLAAEYLSSAEDQCHVYLSAMVRILRHALRTPQYAATKTTQRLRRWNQYRITVEHDGVDGLPGERVRCPSCSEYRDDGLQGEGVTVSHAAPLCGTDDGRVWIIPDGCHHRQFSILCRSCTYRWYTSPDGEPLTPMLVDDPDGHEHEHHVHHEDDEPLMAFPTGSGADDYGPN